MDGWHLYVDWNFGTVIANVYRSNVDGYTNLDGDFLADFYAKCTKLALLDANENFT